MKIVMINSVTYGSTGKIMLQIAETARAAGHEAYVCYPKGRHNPKVLENSIPIGGRFSEDFHLIMDRFTGLNGCFSIVATRRFIQKLKKIKPDVIHLHNLHNCYINLKLLFNYIKKENIRVIWTLHDCWAFTGHCPYFDMANCDKWKTGCFQCPLFREYPKSFTDNSKKMYKLKKSWFTGIEDMTLVTPSKWLADLVKKSFLKEYPVQVIHNGIDLSVFQPTESDFRKKYRLENKTILLGVAFGWEKRKGLDVFIQLADELDERFQIVLVGTDDRVDKQLPAHIISIHWTQDQHELAGIYSTADVLINPTREDNYPTVNMEAIACGTPVITYRSGGSPESLDTTCGCVVKKDDYQALKNAILEVASKVSDMQKECIEKSRFHEMWKKFKEYIELYENE